MSNILIVNASPRRGGNIDRVLNLVEERLRRGGDVDVQLVRVDELSVRPCRACMACRKTGRCTMTPEDDGHRFAELLREADCLIIGAPTYWANIPGPLKTLLDRCVATLIDTSAPSRLLPRPLCKGKRAVLLTASTTPWPWNSLAGQSSGCLKALKSILRPAGYRIRSAAIPGTCKQPPSDTTVTKTADRIVRFLRSMYGRI